jgi:hypothetical protein
MSWLNTWWPSFMMRINDIHDVGTFKLLCVFLGAVVVCQYFLWKRKSKKNRLAELFLKELNKYEVYKNSTVQESLKILARKDLDNWVRLENKAVLREFIKMNENGNRRIRRPAPRKEVHDRQKPSESSRPKVRLTEVTRSVDADEDTIRNIFHQHQHKQQERKAG